jgi:lipopolysaccharide transport system permease protein
MLVDRPLTVIQPTPGWRTLDLAELWRFRELIFFLAWRDVKLQYNRAAFGLLWTVLRPLVAATVFTVVFGRLAKVPSDGLPYPVFAFLGLIPWNYFAKTTTNSGGSLLSGRNLITKVYFPRLILPLSAALSGLVELAIGFAVLLVLLPIFGQIISPTIVIVPLFIALAVLTSLSIGVWLAALDVRYKDVRYLIPFLMQLWLFATPVIYPSSLIPDQLRTLYGLNPMAGVVDGFRWAVLGQAAPPGPMLALSVLVVGLTLVSGLFYFRRVERTFADVL